MTDSEKPPRDLFWFWVVLAFVIVTTVWVTVYIIAKKNPNPLIELETQASAMDFSQRHKGAKIGGAISWTDVSVVDGHAFLLSARSPWT